ncbi:hypothetical protein MKW98_011892 [Papaver atlanticum]|uniref:Uncharacterized protein n=1 Tax=Papaver atlanticum TaxID=357466 RepID=A0AAD4T723_9MAGN|nr:hypothetical protein MKW98_011892 [Papaver atlanticum]
MDDEEAIKVLHEVYGDVEELDILVDLLAEKKINGVVISETTFFISTVMASRIVTIIYCVACFWTVSMFKEDRNGTCIDATVTKEKYNLSYYMDHTDFRSAVFVLVVVTICTLHVWRWCPCKSFHGHHFHVQQSATLIVAQSAGVVLLH